MVHGPRPGGVVSGRGASLSLTSSGSTIPAHDDSVQVDVELRWPDRKSLSKVRHSITEKELKDIPPVKDLTEYGDSPTMTVSPRNSAKSDRNIHVDSSFHTLFKKMGAELTGEVKEEVRKNLLRRTKVYRIYMWIRQVRDTVPCHVERSR